MSDPRVSIIIPLRDAERQVASIVRRAREIEAGPWDQDLPFEILALDQRSGDNTLAALSVLHGQVPSLRTLQDLAWGTAIRRAAAVARGGVWLLLDRAVDLDLARWGVGQVLSGHRAAVVPGEILGVDRATGTAVLRGTRGGLVSAQEAVLRHLRGQGDAAAWSPAPSRGPVARAHLFLRRRLGRVGLSRLDRPYNGN